ncbi:hypothetical protein OC845_006845 [Tilletia horrida]|nr:hypothetical protein OC845_006845 [Tilletia horrida]
MRNKTSALSHAWWPDASVSTARLPPSANLTRHLFDALVKTPHAGRRRPIPPSIADAIHCIERRLTNCVVIAGTGTGKALTWQLGARIAASVDQLILLVVPYVALLADIIKTCAERGIVASEWKPGHNNDVLANTPSVVLVSLNRVVSDEFLQWTARPEVRDAVRTVFVDECHVLVEETFRRSVSDFTRVTHVLDEKQFVFLTATLAPVLEKDFQRKICLPVKYLRNPTHRINLVYAIQHAANVQDALGQAKAKIDQTLQKATEDTQVLIICKTVGEAVQAGAFFDCPVYHASLGDDNTDSENNIAHFLSGNVKVLAGTTAVGVGVDVPKIGLVVFLGDPYSIASFSQGAGRAGRDGSRAEVVVIRIGRVKAGTSRPGPLPRTEAEALTMLLDANVCLQLPLTQWLDGRMSSCIELGAEFCSVCRVEEATNLTSASRVSSTALGPSSTTSSQAQTVCVPNSQHTALIKTEPASQAVPMTFRPATQDRGSHGQVRKARPWQEPITPQTASKRSRIDLDEKLFGPIYGNDAQGLITPKSEQLSPFKSRSSSTQANARSPALQTSPGWKQTSPFLRAGNSSAGGFRGGSHSTHGPGPARRPVRSLSSMAIPTSSDRPLRSLSDIGSQVSAGLGSFDKLRIRETSAHSQSPPASSISRMVNSDPEYAQQLSDFATYRHKIQTAMARMNRTCPMCFMLDRDDEHSPGMCKVPGLSWADQQTFREHPDNNWSDRQACFLCNMPQVICGRSNQEKSCPFQRHKDGIRGILLLLTTHEGVRHGAVEVATQINPDYQLSEPAGLGRMGSAWRQRAPFGNEHSMYRAFQAVAAVLLMVDGGFTF